MFAYLYKNWAFMCLPVAFYVMLILCISLQQGMPWYDFLIWLQFPVYLLHEFEEHAWPGGFKKFVNQEVFHVYDKESPLDDRGIFWVNIPLIWVLFPLCATISQLGYPEIGLFLPIFGLVNATISHFVVTILKQKYNPGLWTSLFLIYPTGIYTLVVAHQLGLLNFWPIIWAVIASLIIHVAIVASIKMKLFHE